MKSNKTDNAFLSDKIKQREYFISKYLTGNPIVLDCCAGYGKVWEKFRSNIDYIGFDLQKRKGTVNADSIKFLASGKVKCDILDIDTYGSPWRHLIIFLSKNKVIPGKVMLLFLTCGSTMFKAQQLEVLEKSGCIFESKIPSSLPGKFENELQNSALSVILDYMEILECRVVLHDRVKYFGLAVKGREV